MAVKIEVHETSKGRLELFSKFFDMGYFWVELSVC
jgi:hypothetical protein